MIIIPPQSPPLSGVDAMITDLPDLAKPLANSIAEEQGLTDRLLDRIRRPVGS